MPFTNFSIVIDNMFNFLSAQNACDISKSLSKSQDCTKYNEPCAKLCQIHSLYVSLISLQ